MSDRSNGGREPPGPGLCADCAHAERLTSAKGSVFWRCTHPELPKYPQLPVQQCAGYARQPVDEPG